MSGPGPSSIPGINYHLLNYGLRICEFCGQMCKRMARCVGCGAPDREKE